jgi:hypothetical protein
MRRALDSHREINGQGRIEFTRINIQYVHARLSCGPGVTVFALSTEYSYTGTANFLIDRSSSAQRHAPYRRRQVQTKRLDRDGSA